MDGHAGHPMAEVLRSAGVGTVYTLSGGHIFPIRDVATDPSVAYPRSSNLA